MRAISLHQPWASAIAFGSKRIETRHWSTPYRGPIAIHAAKRWTRYQADFADIARTNRQIPADELPLGAIVAVATLLGCTPAEALCISTLEAAWGDFSRGRFGWVLDEIRPLREPLPWRGRQSMFSIPDEALEGLIP